MRRLGNYDLLDELGRGGMGVVYKAVQQRADRIVAVKLILGGAASGEADRERFLAEVRSLARLRHANIVSVFEVGEEQGCPFFSMEFVPGGTLAARLQEAPLTPAQAASIVEKLAGAVEQAHQLGVLHRDIKPANVLLDADGTPKLTDFGLAKRLDRDEGITHTGAIVGTPTYMAPEQAAGNKELTPAADVYSLGATLYALLTGRPPFVGGNALETTHKVVHDDPVPPRQRRPNLSRDLEAVCLKCLEKRPADRYESAQALADDLQRWREGHSTVARPLSWPQRCWRQGKRHWKVAALVVAFAATVLLVALAMSPRSPLAPIDRALARGEKVTLIASRGGPRWHQWSLGTGDISDPNASSVFQVFSANAGYLELAPRTHCQRFRLSGEFQHQASTKATSLAGIYFARTSRRPSSAGVVDRVVAVEFRDDLLNNQPMLPKGDPLNVQDYLIFSSEHHPLHPVPANQAVLWVQEVKRPESRPWRKLVVEVGPESIRVFFQRDIREPAVEMQPSPIGIESHLHLPEQHRQILERDHPGLTSESPAYDPAGGVGLYVKNARVFFRNVVLEPLP